jgi:hypothetical protein
VSLRGEGQVCLCNPWSGKLLPLGFENRGGRSEGRISIEEDELLLLAVFGNAQAPGGAALCSATEGAAPRNATEGAALRRAAGGVALRSAAGGAALRNVTEGTALRNTAGGAGEAVEAAGHLEIRCNSTMEAAEHLEIRCNSTMEAAEHLKIRFDRLELEEFAPRAPEEKSFLRSGFGAGKRTALALSGPTPLKPWRALSPELATFAGRGVYHGAFNVEGKSPELRYILCLGEVCDTFHVHLNGRPAPFPDQVLKEVDVTELVEEGANHIRVMVSSNLYNRILSDPQDAPIPLPVPIPYVPKDYGIWESDGKRCEVRVLRAQNSGGAT